MHHHPLLCPIPIHPPKKTLNRSNVVVKVFPVSFVNVDLISYRTWNGGSRPMMCNAMPPTCMRPLEMLEMPNGDRSRDEERSENGKKSWNAGNWYMLDAAHSGNDIGLAGCVALVHAVVR